MGSNGRTTWSPWSTEDSTKLMDLCASRTQTFRRDRFKISNAAWAEIVKQFPGRSLLGCQQRYGLMKAKAEGRKFPKRCRRKTNPAYVHHFPEEIALRAQPIDLPPPASITAWICGDPLPGRSALDKKREGIPA